MIASNTGQSQIAKMIIFKIIGVNESLNDFTDIINITKSKIDKSRFHQTLLLFLKEPHPLYALRS